MKRIALLALVAACGGDSGPDLKQLLGAEVKPPFGLDQLRRGMTLIEAQQVAGLEEILEPGVEALTKPTGDRVVELEVPLIGGRVSEIVLELRALKDPGPVEALWGAPTSTTKEGVAWVGKDQAWYAHLYCGVASLGCRMRFVPYRPLDAAALGATPALPPWLGPLRFGMTKDELTALTITTSTIATEYMDVTRRLVLDGRGKLDAVRFDIRGNAMPALEQAWGPGRRWFDPSTGVRATAELFAAEPGLRFYDETELVFEPYVPLAQILDVLETGLVGRPATELEAIAATIPGAKAGQLAIELPRTEHADAGRTIYLTADGADRILSAQLTLPEVPELTAALARRWPTLPPRIGVSTKDGWISVAVAGP